MVRSGVKCHRSAFDLALLVGSDSEDEILLPTGSKTQFPVNPVLSGENQPGHRCRVRGR
jgi:hypothetical protein